MAGPLVSVVVPTYNRAYCLARAIDSALGQEGPDVEVVVVDDGSTDGTPKAIAERYGDEPRVRCIRQGNQGVSAARNRGLEDCRGEFIAFLDSDDFWKPGKLLLQVAVMEHCPQAGMVWTDMEAIGPDGNVQNPRYLRTMYGAWKGKTAQDLFGLGHPVSDLLIQPGGDALALLKSRRIQGQPHYYCGDIFSPMFLGSLVHTSTVLIRRSCLEKVKGFNPELLVSGEDYDFHFRTCGAGPVAFIDLPLIQYQTGMADQLSRPANWGYCAVNCLKTILPVIESGRPIDLPRRAIGRRLSQVHEWVGQAMVERGDRSSGRRHFLASILHDPYRGGPWRLLAVTCLPAALDHCVRRSYRRARALAQASKAPGRGAATSGLS